MLQETHEWLCKAKSFTSKELQQRGWEPAYDLTTWHEYPDTNRATTAGVVLQSISGGFLGTGGGPTDEVTKFAGALRQFFLK
jgi:hypothetical protein